MKKLFTLFLALVATTALWAEDFEVNGIYYNILADKTNEVEVTYCGSYYYSYDNEYSGSVTIPKTVTYNGTTYSVTSIGYGAFYYCTSLTSITIPNSVTSIGESAFAGCYSLTSVTIPNGVTSIGAFLFEECTSLISITIPNGVTTIGNKAFYVCKSLTSVAIPNSVTSIESFAFGGCLSLTSITIPNRVTSIGKCAFAWCSGLTFIESLAEVPPTLGTDVFKKDIPEDIPVYVPCESLADYQSAEGWKDFTNIQCMPEDESAVDNVHSQSPMTNVQKIFRDGQLLIIRDGVEYNAMGVEL